MKQKTAIPRENIFSQFNNGHVMFIQLIIAVE